MLTITEADAVLVRAAYEQGGEQSAVDRLMALFPAITHPARARLCVRILISRKPLTMPLALTRLPRRTGPATRTPDR